MRLLRFHAVFILMAAGAHRAESQGMAPALKAIEELRLDGTTHDLVPINYMTMLQDGGIAVGQPVDGTVRFFDRDGHDLGKFGRTGAGPAEFKWVGRLGLLRDTLWVLDGELPRITFVSRSLQFVRSIPTPVQLSSRSEASGGAFAVTTTVGVVAVFAGHDLLVSALVPPVHQPVDWQFLEPGVTAFLRVSHTGVFQALVARVPSASRYCFESIDRTLVRIPECTGPVWGTAPDASRFVLVTPSIRGVDRGTLRILAIGPRGDTVFSRSYPFEPQVITAKLADSIRNARIAESHVPGNIAAIRRVSIPPLFPPVEYVVVGLDSTTWIGLRPVGQMRNWLVLTSKGDRLGTVAMPKGVRIRAADRGIVWGTESNADDVESIVRYRVGHSGP